jgi:hypothetical protein
MLFNVCGSQGPEILHGNWEAVGVPSSNDFNSAFPLIPSLVTFCVCCMVEKC